MPGQEELVCSRFSRCESCTLGKVHGSSRWRKVSVGPQTSEGGRCAAGSLEPGAYCSGRCSASMEVSVLQRVGCDTGACLL